jgi:hypothetical protein
MGTTEMVPPTPDRPPEHQCRPTWAETAGPLVGPLPDVTGAVRRCDVCGQHWLGSRYGWKPISARRANHLLIRHRRKTSRINADATGCS